MRLFKLTEGFVRKSGNLNTFLENSRPGAPNLWGFKTKFWLFLLIQVLAKFLVFF